MCCGERGPELDNLATVLCSFSAELERQVPTTPLISPAAGAGCCRRGEGPGLILLVPQLPDSNT